ncbi:unnamed protein product [Phytophthora lilii]|uniref:Unnamed protein product n=1 Tax=Phytophthora lilii TaxID=2077276 RepID=A0A9W6U8F6_9STRA|nr:unnamed protein product [Phytophthora lilii]
MILTRDYVADSLGVSGDHSRFRLAALRTRLTPMTQDAVKKKLNRNGLDDRAPDQKRVRLSPPKLPSTALPPLRTLAAQRPSSPPPTAQKLVELRRRYLEDISMVVQELKTVLTFCPGSTCPDTPVPPSVVLKLVRTVQTLEKLRALLLTNPARLRRVSLAQLDTVEQQIKMNLLPLATLLRSFDGKQEAAKDQDHARAASPIGDGTVKLEQGWTHHNDTKSPRSPSAMAVAPIPQRDWRFLSMALSLQL